MPSSTFYPATGSDDGHWFVSGTFSGQLYNNSSDVVFGNYPSGKIHAFCRFSIDIPAGATIISAIPHFVSIDSHSVAFDVNVSFVDADNPSAPTSASTANAMALTDVINWQNSTAWVSETTYDGPDVATLLQAVIDRSGYVSGSHVILIVAENASASNGYRRSYALEGSTAKEISLEVSWEEAESSIPAGTIPWSGLAPHVSRAEAPTGTITWSGLAPHVSRAEAPTGTITWAGLAPFKPVVYQRIVGRWSLPVYQRIVGRWSLPVYQRIVGRWSLPVYQRIVGRWLVPGISRRIVGKWSLPGTISRRIVGKWSLPGMVSRRIVGRWSLLESTPVSRRIIGHWSLPSLTPSVAATTWSWSLGDDYDLDGLTLTGDRDSFAWTVELTLADEATYLACAPGQRLLITLAGQAMALILESRTREVACGTVSYTATGRTLSCLLDTPYSDTVIRTWARTTARAAAEALCAAVKLDLAWEVCDWTIPAGRLTASAETPISILSRLAAACGAVVQPTLVGGVRVIYRYPVGVNELADVTPAVSLDFDRTVETLSEEFQGQPGYDAVTVVDDRAETTAYLSVTTDDSRNAGRTTFPPGEPCYIRVYHETDYTVAVTSGTAERVVQDETESLSAMVTFDGADTTDLEALVASVDDVIWFGTDGGEAVPNGGASIILAGGAVFGVALITYTTRYDVWRYTPAALGETFAAAIRVEAEDIVSDDTDIGGMRLTVSRGDGLVLAPDELSAALACSPAPATQAGRNYLDEYGQSSLSVDVKSWPEGNETWSLPGDVVEVADTDRGETWRGTATAVSLELTVDDTGARLLTETTTVERPMP